MWAWADSTSRVTLCRILAGRGKAQRQALLGETFGGASEQRAGRLLALADKMFRLRRRVRDGALERSAFQAQGGELLWEGAALDYAATRNTSVNLLKIEAAQWIARAGWPPLEARCAAMTQGEHR